MTTTDKLAPSYNEVKAALEIVARNDPDTANDMKNSLNQTRNDVVQYSRIANDVVSISQEWLRVEAEEVEEPAEVIEEPTKLAKKQKRQARRRSSRTLPKAQTHFWEKEQLARQEPLLYRGIGFGLWLFVLVGTVLTYIGGVEQANVGSTGFWIGIVIAVVWQIGLTYVQFILCHNLKNPVYWLAVFASTLPAFITYRTLLIIPIAQYFLGENVFVESNNGMIWVVVQGIGCIGLIFADIIPERVFVKH